MNAKLVPYTFKIDPAVKERLPELAAEHGFTIAQLLRAVLYRLATGRLTIEFHQDEIGNKGGRNKA